MNKHKEREETAAMEQMMFNVENNLQDTTVSEQCVGGRGEGVVEGNHISYTYLHTSQ